MSSRPCFHFRRLETLAEPRSDVCESCVAAGDTWVHLRSCLVCGVVGCCDNSKNRHARKHWEERDHPVIRSLEPGETWKFCFPERQAFE